MRNSYFSAEEKRIARVKTRLKTGKGRYTSVHELYSSSQEFHCAHCHRLVSTDPLLSGVKNRNHCPYCLWSRHLDLEQAGDRLAACKAPMKPVGLALKRTQKKYAPAGEGGELMLIHLCVECGQASINRIAADDDLETLVAVFRSSAHLDAYLHNRLKAGRIEALRAEDAPVIETQLYGAAALP